MCVGAADYDFGEPSARASPVSDEEFEEANEVLLEQLEKDAFSYEGRLLAAEVCEHLRRFDQAIQHLDQLLASPSLMPAQRDYAINARRRFEIIKLSAPKSP